MRLSAIGDERCDDPPGRERAYGSGFSSDAGMHRGNEARWTHPHGHGSDHHLGVPVVHEAARDAHVPLALVPGGHLALELDLRPALLLVRVAVGAVGGGSGWDARFRSRVAGPDACASAGRAG